MADALTAREPSAAIELARTAEPAVGDGGVATALRDRYELERLRAENARLDEARRELLETLDARTQPRRPAGR